MSTGRWAWAVRPSCFLLSPFSLCQQGGRPGLSGRVASSCLFPLCVNRAVGLGCHAELLPIVSFLSVSTGRWAWAVMPSCFLLSLSSLCQQGGGPGLSCRVASYCLLSLCVNREVGLGCHAELLPIVSFLSVSTGRWAWAVMPSCFLLSPSSLRQQGGGPGLSCRVASYCLLSLCVNREVGLGCHAELLPIVSFLSVSTGRWAWTVRPSCFLLSPSSLCQQGGGPGLSCRVASYCLLPLCVNRAVGLGCQALFHSSLVSNKPYGFCGREAP